MHFLFTQTLKIVITQQNRRLQDTRRVFLHQQF
jgi:hypothetical protein